MDSGLPASDLKERVRRGGSVTEWLGALVYPRVSAHPCVPQPSPTAAWLWSRPGPPRGELWEGSTGLGLNLRGPPSQHPCKQVAGKQNPRLRRPSWVKCGPTRALFSEASQVKGQDPVFTRCQRSPLCSRRNLRKGSSGLADEINFEDFLTIMSYFRPIDTTMDEEQVQLCRKEKLRCACALGPGRVSPRPAAPLQPAGGRVWRGGPGDANPRPSGGQSQLTAPTEAPRGCFLPPRLCCSSWGSQGHVKRARPLVQADLGPFR